MKGSAVCRTQYQAVSCNCRLAKSCQAEFAEHAQLGLLLLSPFLRFSPPVHLLHVSVLSSFAYEFVSFLSSSSSFPCTARSAWAYGTCWSTTCEGFGLGKHPCGASRTLTATCATCSSSPRGECASGTRRCRWVPPMTLIDTRRLHVSTHVEQVRLAVKSCTAPPDRFVCSENATPVVTWSREPPALPRSPNVFVGEPRGDVSLRSSCFLLPSI